MNRAGGRKQEARGRRAAGGQRTTDNGQGAPPVRRPQASGASAPLSFLAALLLALAACGGAGGLDVTDAWGRSSPMVADAAAFYVTIENGGDEGDTLVAASSDRCGAIELHNSMMNDEGVMMMDQADPSLLAIPAGGSLEMAPGGLHVMCLQVTEAPQLGEEIDLTLEFESGTSVDVVVSIEDR